jgi:hypothetical protein
MNSINININNNQGHSNRRIISFNNNDNDDDDHNLVLTTMEMHVQMIHEFLGYADADANNNNGNTTEDDQIDLLVNELPTLNACILFLKLTEYICYHSDNYNNNNDDRDAAANNNTIRSVKPNVIRKSVALWEAEMQTENNNNNNNNTGGGGGGDGDNNNGITKGQKAMINDLICNAIKSSASTSTSSGAIKRDINNIEINSSTTTCSTTSACSDDDGSDTTTNDDTDDTDTITDENEKAAIQKLVKELDYELNMPQKEDEVIIDNFHETVCRGRKLSE